MGASITNREAAFDFLASIRVGRHVSLLHRPIVCNVLCILLTADLWCMEAAGIIIFCTQACHSLSLLELMGLRC